MNDIKRSLPQCSLDQITLVQTQVSDIFYASTELLVRIQSTNKTQEKQVANLSSLFPPLPQHSSQYTQLLTQFLTTGSTVSHLPIPDPTPSFPASISSPLPSTTSTTSTTTIVATDALSYDISSMSDEVKATTSIIQSTVLNPAITTPTAVLTSSSPPQPPPPPPPPTTTTTTTTTTTATLNHTPIAKRKGRQKASQTPQPILTIQHDPQPASSTLLSLSDQHQPLSLNQKGLDSSTSFFSPSTSALLSRTISLHRSSTQRYPQLHSQAQIPYLLPQSLSTLPPPPISRQELVNFVTSTLTFHVDPLPSSNYSLNCSSISELEVLLKHINNPPKHYKIPHPKDPNKLLHPFSTAQPHGWDGPAGIFFTILQDSYLWSFIGEKYVPVSSIPFGEPFISQCDHYSFAVHPTRYMKEYVTEYEKYTKELDAFCNYYKINLRGVVATEIVADLDMDKFPLGGPSKPILPISSPPTIVPCKDVYTLLQSMTASHHSKRARLIDLQNKLTQLTRRPIVAIGPFLGNIVPNPTNQNHIPFFRISTIEPQLIPLQGNSDGAILSSANSTTQLNTTTTTTTTSTSTSGTGKRGGPKGKKNLDLFYDNQLKELTQALGSNPKLTPEQIHQLVQTTMNDPSTIFFVYDHHLTPRLLFPISTIIQMDFVFALATIVIGSPEVLRPPILPYAKILPYMESKVDSQNTIIRILKELPPRELLQFLGGNSSSQSIKLATYYRELRSYHDLEQFWIQIDQNSITNAMSDE